MKWDRLYRDHRFLQTMHALYIPSLCIMIEMKVLWIWPLAATISGIEKQANNKLRHNSNLTNEIQGQVTQAGWDSGLAGRAVHPSCHY